MAWEKTALDLAADAGIAVPRSQLLDVEGYSVLLLHRFDRDGADRVGYSSAMTLLSSEDGQSRDYLEVADAMSTVSDRTDDDLEQLWRRIAFSVAIHNTDDHLRNLGYLRQGRGWRLSPAFDLNPNPVVGDRRVTSIGGVDIVGEEGATLLRIAPEFGLSETRARAVLDEVVGAVRGWREAARVNHVVDRELERFRAVFEAGLDSLTR